jgi:uncharacterized damage-inducible protein DinB
MELQRHIGRELSGLKMAMDRALDSLTQEEISWRPASGCNSIGLILLHAARSEDSFIQTRLKEETQIWESEKWYEKLNLSVSEEGAHYTVDQVNAFKAPPLNDLLASGDAVRAKTKESLRGMAPEELDRTITFPNFGELPVATIFSLIVAHTSQHIGEISYLRGLQRGMDK